MSLRDGEIVDGLYQIQETFGGGGMGLVHRARHRVWNIEVAIKHPHEKCMHSAADLELFHSECATWAKIGLHPYIATCFYTGNLNGLPCVVAEYVPGGSLQDAIERRDLYKGEEDACLVPMLAIAASTAWGLARAHESNLIHCDVKPGNMLLVSHGLGKICDFGLAVSLASDGNGSKSTGYMTRQFASPEQSRGDGLTLATDIWSWAASMLAMFTGGVSWESGAVCGAVLREFLEGGGKAYRIPPIPEQFATLLGECFRFAPDARISDFSLIAERICQCYEELFGESCPASKPDLELISADSLNNRAVSRFDLGDISEVRRLLGDALTVDPLHPESNFNSAVLGYSLTQTVSQTFLDRLEQVTHFDLGEYRPWLYRACLLNMGGCSREAFDSLSKARELAVAHEASDVQRLWDQCTQRKLNPVLALPISGEDFAHDSTRFERLMSKAEVAVREYRLDDAKRYLLMSGDISGFARHPRRGRVLAKINQ